MEFSQDLHVKNQRLFHIKIILNIYCVRNVDQAFSESLNLLVKPFAVSLNDERKLSCEERRVRR